MEGLGLTGSCSYYLAFVAMVGEGGCDAKRQRLSGHGVGLVEYDGTVALEFELAREQGSECVDEVRLAVKVHRVLRGT